MAARIMITIRLPQALHEAAVQLAKRRRVSLSRLVQESLEAALEADEDRRLREAFDLLGQDKELTDVEYAFEAQREVVLRDEE